MSQNDQSDVELINKNSVNQNERTIKSSNGIYSTIDIAIIAILTALTCIATMVIGIPIPGSQGYFNVGEVIIYFTAICFGRKKAAFVGGVGASLADVLLGYTIWAPGTLIIKALEGYIVGSLFSKYKQSSKIQEKWKEFTITMGLILGGIIIGIGVFIESLNLNVSIILGVIVVLISFGLGFTVQKDTGIKLAAIIPGGIILVLGYFLYTSLIISTTSAAIVALIPDFMQFFISTIIAIPLIAALEPFIKNKF